MHSQLEQIQLDKSEGDNQPAVGSLLWAAAGLGK